MPTLAWVCCRITTSSTNIPLVNPFAGGTFGRFGGSTSGLAQLFTNQRYQVFRLFQRECAQA